MAEHDNGALWIQQEKNPGNVQLIQYPVFWILPFYTTEDGGNVDGDGRCNADAENARY